MSEPAYRCPECYSDVVSLQVVAWADFESGAFAAFESGEHPYVPHGAGGICHKCGHEWKLERDDEVVL